MKVAVFGGGVAGLTAAHELIERGYEVDVYEARGTFGGKARSIEIPGTATPGRNPLPGEHGFRFFPGFYKHVPDTMGRIPVGGSKTAADNLVPATQMLLARHRADEVILPSGPPDGVREAKTFLEAATGTVGISGFEALKFWGKSLKFVTSCSERRFGEFEYTSWWDFIEAQEQSEGYRRFLAQGATRSLVAMKAETSSTRTIGTIYFQMLRDLLDPRIDVDRLLNGPTNEVWIDPWVEHLSNLGAVFHPEHRVTEIEIGGAQVSRVHVESAAGAEGVQADYFVFALPVEVMVELVSEDVVAIAPRLERLRFLETAWMNGIQYFLDGDVRISHGHGLYLDSPWALTSISQPQFWDRDLSEYGDGTVKGLLSVVVSDWESPGLLLGKPAKECTPQEICDEVWHQLEFHLSDDDVDELAQVNIVDWFLDPAIVQPNPHDTVNLEPLLINTTGSWDDRPNADEGLGNAFLASDYVRTNTDLATMEAANEAARRAVNEIISRTGLGEPCAVWELDEWAAFTPLQAFDSVCYERGVPHLFDMIGTVFGR